MSTGTSAGRAGAAVVRVAEVVTSSDGSCARGPRRSFGFRPADAVASTALPGEPRSGMPEWVQDAVWWHVYPLGFLGAEPELPADDAVIHRLDRLVDWL